MSINAQESRETYTLEEKEAKGFLSLPIQLQLAAFLQKKALSQQT